MGEILIIALVIIAVIVMLPLAIFMKITDVQSSLQQTNDKLNKALEELDKLKHGTFKTGKTEEKIIIAEKEVTPPVVTQTKPAEPIIVPPVIETKPVDPVIIPPPVEKAKEQPVPEIKQEPIEEDFVAAESEIYEEVDERKLAEVKEDRWFKNNSDWEKFIGENLANKIGIAVLVLGIAFFVKYAIDKDWVNETGRVIIGLVCGGILIGVAHYIRNSYRSFSSVLVGGGLSVFYFTIAFAFHQYHLISQQAAFIIMVIISAFAVLLSLYYNRQELAILATIGGFITPFLVSTGQNNYVALFTYLCILNTALMVLAWFKRWVAINIISLLFTTFIYGGWLIDGAVISYTNAFPYKDAFLFATLFYLLFVVMNIINSLRMNRKFTAFDFIILLSTNFLYYAAGGVSLSYSESDNSQGIFTASLGLFNLLLALTFFRKKNVDRSFVSLLIGLAVTFVSLTAPVHFQGSKIVLFWAAEMVVLFWLYQRSKIRQLKFASLFIAALMIVSLLFTWAEVYLSGLEVIPVITNKGFMTTLASSIALFIFYSLLRKEKGEVYLGAITNQGARAAMLTSSIAIAYAAGILEIFFQFASRYTDIDNIHVVYQQLYTFVFTIVLLQVFKRKSFFPLFKFILTAFCLGLYLVNLRNNYSISIELFRDDNAALFSAHWIAAALLFWLLYDMVRFFFKEKNNDWISYKPAFTWIAAASMILLLSVEMYHVIVWVLLDMNEWDWWENLYYKPALTILWSLCSFVMMWLGMKYSFRTLRIISLTLFTITLIKLFSYDLVKIPPGGKIAAFILLGILLLTVSFMYQRLKKIIIDNTSG